MGGMGSLLILIFLFLLIPLPAGRKTWDRKLSQKDGGQKHGEKKNANLSPIRANSWNSCLPPPIFLTPIFLTYFSVPNFSVSPPRAGRRTFGFELGTCNFHPPLANRASNSLGVMISIPKGFCKTSKSSSRDTITSAFADKAHAR